MQSKRTSGNQELVYQFNGLLLLSHYHRLFERGLKAFNHDGGIINIKGFFRESLF